MRKSPFIVERNPWTRADELERFTLYRGAIIGAWAQIEGHLSEVLICCSKGPAYARMLLGKFPARRPEQIAAMRLVLETHGHLLPWPPLDEVFQDHEPADIQGKRAFATPADRRGRLDPVVPGLGFSIGDCPEIGPLHACDLFFG